MNVSAIADRPGPGHFVRLVQQAVLGITRTQVRGTVLFGVFAFAIATVIHLTPVMQFADTMPMHWFFIGKAIVYQINAFCLLTAIVVADRAVDEGARRRLAYAGAALGGCVAGVLISETFDWAWRTFILPDLWPAHRPYLRGPGSLFYFPTYGLTNWLLLGTPAVFFYAERRAARKTEAHLHVAELDRIRSSKLALESRLQAMQARVEPQFLFSTLAQVEHLYELDPGLGGRMLDELIAYLRAAMPKMRDTSSTLAQEVELVRAYLAIIKVRLGDRLTYEIDIPVHAGDVRIPPMMLLPLADHAVVHGLEQSYAYGTIRIACEIAGRSLRLTIVDQGAGFVPKPTAAGIASIRERLAALYGGDARLELRAREAGGTEAIMEIPCEWVKRGEQ